MLEPKSPSDVVETQVGAPVAYESWRIVPPVEEETLAKVLAELA